MRERPEDSQGKGKVRQAGVGQGGTNEGKPGRPGTGQSEANLVDLTFEVIHGLTSPFRRTAREFQLLNLRGRHSLPNFISRLLIAISDDQKQNRSRAVSFQTAAHQRWWHVYE